MTRMRMRSKQKKKGETKMKKRILILALALAVIMNTMPVFAMTEAKSKVSKRKEVGENED